MKLQPLDLEEIFEKYKWDLNKNERANYIATEIIRAFGVNKVYEHHNENIDKLKNEIKQRLKSACELYLQYKDKPEKFLDEHPEYTEEVCEKCGHPYVIYEDLFNDWLFHFVFKSVLEDKGK